MAHKISLRCVNFAPVFFVFITNFLTVHTGLISLSKRHMVEIGRNYTNLHDNKISRETIIPSHLQNLEEQLKIFVGCLVHIINYRNTDWTNSLTVPYIPLVLSRYDVLLVTFERTQMKHHQRNTRNSALKFKQSRTFYFNRVPSKNQTEIGWCELHWLEMDCMDIPFIDMSPKIKMRNHCEAHFYLFPPGKEEDPVFYEKDPTSSEFILTIPGSFRKFWHRRIPPEKSNERAINKLVYAEEYFILDRRKFDILIVTDDEYFSGETEYSWVRSLTVTRGWSPEHYTRTYYDLLVMEAIVKGDSTSKIASMSIMCRHCEPCDMFQPLPINLPENFEDLERISRILNGKLNLMFWTIWTEANLVSSLSLDPTRIHREYQLFLDFHKLRETRSSIFPIYLSSSAFQSLRLMVEMALLRSLFENGTMYVGGQNNGFHVLGQECPSINDNPPPPNPIVAILPTGQLDYFHFHFHPTHLKFVSCGPPEKAGFPFFQLMTIFDQYIWLCIILSTITTSFSLTMFMRIVARDSTNISDASKASIKFSGSLQCCLQILLEQGHTGIITSRMLNAIMKLETHALAKNTSRFVYALFLLIAIVLSNGYKNENITQLTLPRSPIPYDKFEILVKHNFTIYTRGVWRWGGAGGNMKKLPPAAIWLLYLLRPKEPFYHDISQIFKSELFMFSMAQVSSLTAYFTNDNQNISERATYLLGNTTLHPQWFEMLVDRSVSEIGESILKSCNKTALFLPDIDAQLVYYKMGGDDPKYGYYSGQSVFLGQENDLKNIYGIQFMRWVPPKIISRVKGLYSGGFWDWWHKMLVDVMTGLHSSSLRKARMQTWKGGKVQASDLQGNITVVFFVWLGCILISSMMFIIEARKTTVAGITAGIWNLRSALIEIFREDDIVTINDNENS